MLVNDSIRGNDHLRGLSGKLSAIEIGILAVSEAPEEFTVTIFAKVFQKVDAVHLIPERRGLVPVVENLGALLSLFLQSSTTPPRFACGRNQLHFPTNCAFDFVENGHQR